ncbi:hypothetical protein C4D60_Mb07t02170 [Musa balbisiana]|uniref:Uncharacterized protein ycf23 n=1 Tax=Musa balbisiana TaxID=52838 RepID=A0A4S8JCH7_MUSBA|nr:hypothetical protein C4D60_Mb07t02170 [Musa balbisiana]
MAHGAATGVLPMPLCPAAKQSASGHLHGRADPLLHLRQASRAGRRQPKRWPSFTTRASASTVKESGGATHVDIACDQELVKLALGLTSLPICVSSVDPLAFPPAVEAGAQMVEIGNYDSFYEMGIQFSSEQILKLTRDARRILPSVTLSVTVPHMLNLPDQVKLAELLEQEGADIIQTEGGKYSSPSKPGVLGLIEKATPTLAAAYSISRAVKIPVMCSSGLSAVTAPMALTAGAAGVGVGSAVNKLNDVVAMIAEVKSIAESLGLLSRCASEELSSVRQ